MSSFVDKFSILPFSLSFSQIGLFFFGIEDLNFLLPSLFFVQIDNFEGLVYGAILDTFEAFVRSIFAIATFG